jgi:hypothetical protein
MGLKHALTVQLAEFQVIIIEHCSSTVGFICPL